MDQRRIYSFKTLHSQCLHSCWCLFPQVHLAKQNHIYWIIPYYGNLFGLSMDQQDEKGRLIHK